MVEEVLRGSGEEKKKKEITLRAKPGVALTSAPPRVPNSRRGFQPPGHLCGQGGAGRIDAVRPGGFHLSRKMQPYPFTCLGGRQVLRDVGGMDRLWGAGSFTSFLDHLGTGAELQRLQSGA